MDLIYTPPVIPGLTKVTSLNFTTYSDADGRVTAIYHPATNSLTMTFNLKTPDCVKFIKDFEEMNHITHKGGKRSMKKTSKKPVKKTSKKVSKKTSKKTSRK